MTAANIRPAVRELLSALEFRASVGRPCYIKRTHGYVALIVPHLRNGDVGPYSYLRTFRRATVDEAEELGLVVLGPRLVDVPDAEYPRGHWAAERAHQGRTITTTGGAR
ncbi:hypothetical protein D7231_32055 [Streptomyces klenkii]|uniref:Uncharacterized protein n=1 Tax=Streptomyces klenkii TaxID=1420899 RepID=A0A3B0ARE8_9ACTN|nr:hypothetical protein [Streptomyces klenkii]RKN61906.1 hypothetical protein D7231_32055 [Streptomyces klenkii]